MRKLLSFSNGLSILILFFSITVLNAQETAILKGKIKDSDGKAIPQAYILSDNLAYKTISDDDGNYSLFIPADSSIQINFSHIAYTKSPKYLY